MIHILLPLSLMSATILAGTGIFLLITLLLVAEISIMLRYIARMSRTDIITNPKI